jgi:GTP-binding protein
MHFIDEAKIYLKAGDGGDGSGSMRREKFIEYGGPDGGDGGRGGSIIFECVAGLNTLIDFRYKQHFKVKKAQNGMGKQRYGKSSEDMIIQIPIGTQILCDDKETVIIDMTKAGQQFIIAKGGRGGLGNLHFKSSTNQAPRHFTKGKEGEEKWVWLILKLLADVGLVGLPNAGKSTFLSVASSAKPKIADYPFTTLKPQLGVARVGEKELVIADIPGLIEGASEGKGLGHRFLKHIERCRAILHLVDITNPNFLENYAMIRAELYEYSPDLAEKDEVVALNKCDALSADEIKKATQKFKRRFKITPHIISGVSGAGVENLLEALIEK